MFPRCNVVRSLGIKYQKCNMFQNREYFWTTPEYEDGQKRNAYIPV